MTGTNFSHIDDPEVPALRSLLGEEAREIVSAMLEPTGGELKSARITQIRYTPGRSIVVRYRADVRWKGGRSTSETLVAASGISTPEGVAQLEAGDMKVAF